eukprot:jgi/Botrbrau1/11086/Bobra.0302s0028.1
MGTSLLRAHDYEFEGPCQDDELRPKLPTDTELFENYPFVEWKLHSDARSGRPSAQLQEIVRKFGGDQCEDGGLQSYIPAHVLKSHNGVQQWGGCGSGSPGGCEAGPWGCGGRAGGRAGGAERPTGLGGVLAQPPGAVLRGSAAPPVGRTARGTKEALQNLEQASVLRPKDANILALRGAVKMELGRLHEAVDDLEEADSLQRNHPITLALLGAVKMRLGLHNEALTDVDQAESLDPNDAFTLSVRGYVKELLGQYDAALAHLDRAVAIQPDDADFLYRRAELKSILGKYEEALQDLNRAHDLQPRDAAILQPARSHTHPAQCI